MRKSDPEKLSTPSSDSVQSKSPGKKEKCYKCKFEGCSAVFCRPGRLADHMSAHRGERRFCCKVVGCSKAYTSNSHLKRHVATSHSSHSRLSVTFPSVLLSQCPIPGCKKVLKTRDTLVKHSKRAHGDKLFNCKVCSRNFPSEKQLINHSRKCHHNQDSHRCEKCRMVFAKVGQYNRHMRGHRLHICPHSDCYFTSEQYVLLRRHLAVVHVNFLKCDNCGKEVKDKALMRKHVRVHLAKEGLADPPSTPSATQPFPCSLCTTVLTTKGSLKRHVLTVHSPVPKPRKPVKRGAERAPRLDKGRPRFSTASLLASVDIPTSLNRQLISKDVYSTNDETSNRILEFMLTGWLGTDIPSSDEPFCSE